MSIFKCKMCGGDLAVNENTKIVECEYCGTTQTVPNIDDEKKINLFNRANRLRMGGEFDKAATIYENIVAEFPEEAEAYWGLCLCNYGIEYVDDPATARKIPTCHRASFGSLQNDENFELALEYADVIAQKVYRDEAREIDRIMSDILAVSKNEKPYDVFICYKETDDSGARTVDSVLAQDIYDALTAKGLNVFFARISLEDKLGRQYEPYIFAALNSAKVMLSIGTKYEYFHAVWVKNEWSRFLKLMAKDKSKVLIPCYKDIDAYDMPDEFKALQAQDMGKIGFMQDLVRGIMKITAVDTIETQSTAPMQNQTGSQKEIAFDDGYYIGEAIAGQPNGYGVRYWKEDGERYEGMWKFGEQNGMGKYYYEDELVYEGEFADGDFNGEGILYNEDGSFFKGEFVKGEPWNGTGKYFKYQNNHENEFDGTFVDGIFKDGYMDIAKANGEKVKGIIKDGHLNGEGVYVQSSGSVYEGSFKNDLFDGYGVITLCNGGKVEGYFVDGKLNGKGKHTYGSGAYVECEYVDDKKNGFGIYYHSNGDRYEGMFKNDKRNGHGICYFANGGKWEGEFKDGQPWNGSGMIPTSYDDVDAVYEGGLVEGMFNGYGVLRYVNGTSWEGFFINDRRADTLGLCKHCGGEFKGLIKKVCVKCGKLKDY